MIDVDIRIPAILCVWCMYAVSGLCFLGLICKNYHDNFLQMIGLMGTIFWALGRASKLGEREDASWAQIFDWNVWQTLAKADTVSFYQFLGAFSMMLFGIGTAWKVWIHRNSDTNPNGVHK